MNPYWLGGCYRHAAVVTMGVMASCAEGSSPNKVLAEELPPGGAPVAGVSGGGTRAAGGTAGAATGGVSSGIGGSEPAGAGGFDEVGASGMDQGGAAGGEAPATGGMPAAGAGGSSEPQGEGGAYQPSHTLVGYYRFDAGAGLELLDRSGQGNHGVLKGNPGNLIPEWSLGRIDGALLFGGNNFVHVPHTASLNRINVAGAFTLAAWTERAAHKDSWSMVVSRQYKTSGAEHYGLAFRSGKATALAGTHFCEAAASSALAAWVHLAATYDGAVLRVFEQGNEVCSKNAAGALSNDDTISGLMIGGNANTAELSAQETFVGKVDELVLYSRALLPSEVQSLAAGQPAPGE